MTVTAPGFRTWLDAAKLGDELVYHVGDLAADSDPAKSTASALVLNQLLDEVVKAGNAGRVLLRQEPSPNKGAQRHIARRIA